ncbi:MAG: hypothetical protein HOO92_04210, partial [Methylococcaceae bacterium]|nr:hypothetical protein [Methylococcaceae bacterium]
MKQSLHISKIHQRPISVSQKGLFLASLAIASVAQAGPSPVVSFGAYNSHQVNVDVFGQNIPGDRGNEPTIALNPLNPANIVIGWRM